MMLPIALSALFIGTVAGFLLARRVMLIALALLIAALVALIAIVSVAPPDALPGEGRATLIAAYLIAPPLASGMFGGAVLAWLLRTRSKAT